MTRDEAEREATRRNLELGSKLRGTKRFWIEVARPDGRWDVEEREAPEERSSKKSVIVDGILDALSWWP